MKGQRLGVGIVGLQPGRKVVPGNVARIYARMSRDLRDGTGTAPSFEDAVALHRVIAAIERAAESGISQRVGERF